MHIKNIAYLNFLIITVYGNTEIIHFKTPLNYKEVDLIHTIDNEPILNLNLENNNDNDNDNNYFKKLLPKSYSYGSIDGRLPLVFADDWNDSSINTEIFQLSGLNKDKTYEIRLSWPASIPAKIRLNVYDMYNENTIGNGRNENNSKNFDMNLSNIPLELQKALKKKLFKSNKISDLDSELQLRFKNIFSSQHVVLLFLQARADYFSQYREYMDFPIDLEYNIVVENMHLGIPGSIFIVLTIILLTLSIIYNFVFPSIYDYLMHLSLRGRNNRKVKVVAK